MGLFFEQVKTRIKNTTGKTGRMPAAGTGSWPGCCAPCFVHFMTHIATSEEHLGQGLCEPTGAIVGDRADHRRIAFVANAAAPDAA
jgi:hypothetical protein